MLRKLAVSGIGLLLLASPAVVTAQSADVQSQIASLLAQIKQLQALIVQLQNGSQSNSCVDLNNTLTLGSTGSDVTNLQNYLIAKGDLDAQYSTGYYGFITAQAVGKLQMNLGLVASASDTAFGIMGPKTRAAVACSGTVTPPNNGTFTATPTSGAAPLTLRFFGSNLDGSLTYRIDYGDGTNGNNDTKNGGPLTPISGVIQIAHTYTSAGTYTAKLIGSKDCGAKSCEGILGTATITVTGTNTGTLSVSPGSGPAPLQVSFSPIDTKYSSGSIDFGDGTSSGFDGYCTANNCSFLHTYNASGAYIAKLKDSYGNLVGTATISVTHSQ